MQNLKELYSKITVTIHSFKHDVNGNPIAKHRIDYVRNGASTVNVFWQSKKRSQVGTSNYQDYVNVLLSKVDLKELIALYPDITGSRGEDEIVLTYNLASTKTFECKFNVTSIDELITELENLKNVYKGNAWENHYDKHCSVIIYDKNVGTYRLK